MKHIKRPDTTENAADGRPIVNKENWPEKVPTRGLTKDLTLPLEAYMASYEDQVTIEQAANDLKQSCMKDYGIDLTLPRAGANPPPSDNDVNIERRYGISRPGPRGAARRHSARTTRDPGTTAPAFTGRKRPSACARRRL
ncbi:hypothetical protein [Streptomyces lomondensis]|uniref:Uncharacterized protein n=1 Tax=Streptomyces lomondensis TaxID=68229 RepID=A0ABQ2XAK4_9ACTN|nr:hypothetical protein [Streptomyces lomondensis]MCF0077075.1 hypothetical protein [Streptomyces lomondensis]GGX06905.1 hypothetical protein GCM10010383_41200 [Streptomyces lomondensis]